MRATLFRFGLSAGMLSLALGCAPMALAANGPAQGDTSGPAAGTNTTPSTAVQKQTASPNAGTAAGAPGVSGKQGSQSGTQPKDSIANSGNK
jgi:hypothetical protein